MGYVPTGYYTGMFLGRLLLAEPTFRFGERRMILIYSAICVALQLVFWLAPNIIASATALSLMGFFYGPFFATVCPTMSNYNTLSCALLTLRKIGGIRCIENLPTKDPGRCAQ